MKTLHLVSRWTKSFTFIAFIGLAANALADSTPDPPSDTQVFNIIRSIQMEYAQVELDDFGQAKRTGRDMVLRAIEPLELDRLTPYQLVLLEPFVESGAYWQMRAEQRDALKTSLERAANEHDVNGVIALSMLNLFAWDSSGSDHFRRLMQHPALEEAMQGWPATRILNTFGSLDPPVVLEHLAEIERMVLFMQPHTQTQPLVRPSLMRLFEKLDDPEIADQTGDARRRIHSHLLAVARSTLSRFSPMGSQYGLERYWIDAAIDVVEYLEGPAASGAVVSRPAPELEFLWWRGTDGNPQRLSDLRGKVVVLDFWATWCRPCIALFPGLRDLQAHYADRDVVIIGVTSIQGFHVPVGEPTIRLKDEVENPVERELDLMERFMQRNDVTWNIAFSTRSVVDPRYAVWGIPHLTIIDAKGIVRHNNLSLDATLSQKIELIDALLEGRESE